MKKLYVSCPMRNRKPQCIKDSINKMHKLAELINGEQYELIDSYITQTPPFSELTSDTTIRLWYLGESIKKMSTADAFVGSNYAGKYSGCLVQKTVASLYNIPSLIIPEEIIYSMMPDLVKHKLYMNEDLEE